MRAALTLAGCVFIFTACCKRAPCSHLASVRYGIASLSSIIETLLVECLSVILLQTVAVADQPLQTGALECDYADVPARSLEVAVQGDDEADVCTLALAPVPDFSPDPEDDASDS